MTTTEQFHVQGMHCASCVANIEHALKKIAGITNAMVNLATEQARVDYDATSVTLQQMNAELGKLGYTLHRIDSRVGGGQGEQQQHKGQSGDDTGMNPMNHTEHASPNRAMREQELALLRPKVWFAFPIALTVFVLMVIEIALDFGGGTFFLPMRLWRFLQFLVATPILFWAGRQFLAAVVRFVRHGSAGMDTLVGIGTSVAYMYSAAILIVPEIRAALNLPEDVYFDATIIVIGFILFGKYLEAQSKMKTGAAIEALVKLQANVAHIKRGSEVVDVPLEEVRVNDICIVKAGEKIPVDGKILEGTTHVDESMMTGESMPVARGMGDVVIGATLNKEGVITIQAQHVGAETVLAQIIRMVQEAQGSRAPIQRLADVISSYFVPVVLVLAVITAVVWIIVGNQYMPVHETIPLALTAFVGILVIACPCALGLATPTAVVVGTGTAARNGILVKNAESLEIAHKVTAVIFDKTGTLTQGKPKVTDITAISEFSNDQMLQYAASVEQFSEHPLGIAILNSAKEQGLTIHNATESKIFEGQGIQATVNNTTWRMGTIKFLEEHGMQRNAQLEHDADRMRNEGKTVVAVSRGDAHVGILALADVMKDGARGAVAELQAQGLKLFMMTGDNEKTAETMARAVGIEHVFAEVKPQDKAQKVSELQTAGEIVAMVGDGINDAPALAAANVGIAMSTGTDVAIESADITLLHGDLAKVALALRLSRRTLRIIKQNLFWAFAYNVAGIPLAAGVFYPIFDVMLNPVFAGMAMAFSSVSVVTNSLRLRKT